MIKILLSLALLICLPMVAIASETHEKPIPNADAIVIGTPYAFATTKSAKTGAIFFPIKNTSMNIDSLIGVQSNVAEIVELHQNYVDPDDGMMMMRKVNKIDIEPQSQAVLEPAGYHIMLINLKYPLVIDDTFYLTLFFESGKKIDTEATVVKPGFNPKIDNLDHLHYNEKKDHDHPEETLIDFSDTYLKAQ